jgi:DDE superfamily endonuclease
MNADENDDDDFLFIMTLFSAALWYNSLRSRSRLTRSAILEPKLSPWSRLYHFGDSGSFLQLTGFTRDAFRNLRIVLFGDHDNDGRRVGRPSSLDPNGELGLYLFFVGSTMGLKHLCLIFGVVPTTAAITIWKMMKVICKLLRRHPAAEVSFPDDDLMRIYARMVQSREPMINNVIGFVDGLSLSVQCSDDILRQNASYNGYSHDTAITNVFAFSPLGKIIFAADNYPGSWHDSTVAQDLINIVVSKIGVYALCVDQGFPRSGDLHDRFVGPMSKKIKKKLSPELAEYLIPTHERYISLRQASEWGMRALQGTFSRLKSRMTSNSKKRQKIILSIVLLHNYRTHLMGLNQIATVFNPLYDQYINLDTYDRIQRYFN